jgi:predicted nucleic acid-binding protein
VIVIDTGPLVAIADRRSKDRQACLEVLVNAKPPRLIPTPVITEVCQLLSSRVGTYAEVAFLRSLTGGDVEVANLETNDWARVAELVERYGDLPLGTVDASIVAIAERLRADTVATLDRKALPSGSAASSSSFLPAARGVS